MIWRRWNLCFLVSSRVDIVRVMERLLHVASYYFNILCPACDPSISSLLRLQFHLNVFVLLYIHGGCAAALLSSRALLYLGFGSHLYLPGVAL